MRQTSLNERLTSMVKIPHAPAASRRQSDRARSASIFPPHGDDLTPYSTKELKYLWTLWDEAHRHHSPGLPYRNIYIGAVGVILIGWLLSGIEQAFWVNFGRILMIAGGLTGTWFSLKSLRQQRLSPPGD